MRITVSGSANQGKTTFIQDFIKEWPKYITPSSTYRDIIKKRGHSDQTDEDLQMDIINFMIDDLQKLRRKTKVIIDRCPLDALVYSLWAHDKGKISGQFIDKIIPIVRGSMSFIDLIFFTPITNVHRIEIEDDGVRQTDPQFIEEIDAIFKELVHCYRQPRSVFFDKDDKPALIEIFGSREERIQMVKMYLDTDGDPIAEGQGIINPAEIDELYNAFKNNGFKASNEIIIP
jgi:hypothetical protein